MKMSISKIEYLQTKKINLRTSFVVKIIYHYVIPVLSCDKNAIKRSYGININR